MPETCGWSEFAVPRELAFVTCLLLQFGDILYLHYFSVSDVVPRPFPRFFTIAR